MSIRTFVTAAYIASAFTLASALPAAAQDWIFSAGYSSFSRAGAEDSALVSVEYQHDAFWQRGNFDALFGAALDVQTTGDLFVGAGVVGKWHLRQGWFIETSVMPGAYAESVRLNDLGSTFEIRSALAVGKTFENGRALSLALTHKSNASTADINPGVNSLLLRWHVPFKG
ncbi:acyloxyacyl hydrolase [Phaeobacter inhibens]|uniref:acyloxyacyl hydrolase n=1 Tax=Phaeobacter inhibens TaxID=221822 RepID=UPI000427880D|nr:acyloxyacyl hydrolase [Phaeobacter inhibens]